MFPFFPMQRMIEAQPRYKAFFVLAVIFLAAGAVACAINWARDQPMAGIVYFAGALICVLLSIREKRKFLQARADRKSAAQP